MPTQTRATLKGYFTKGSIPTENNFADLIDSTLVQIDDGLLTSATAPLSIKAVGTDEGLINFYQLNPDKTTTTTWQIKHLPVGSSTPGLSIGTPAATRLFIDNTGNVGIGTTSPAYGLDVKSKGIKLGLEGNGGGQLIIANDANDNKIFLEAFNAAGNGSAAELLLTGRFGGNVPRLSLNADQTLINGNVGIGTQTPGFPLTIGNNTLGDKISLYGQSGNHYGFGIQGYQLQIYTSGASDDVVFGYGSSGSMTETMRIKGNGNVGIGTTAPVSRLDIFQAPRTDPGNHPKAVKGLYVTGDFGSASDGVEFRHSNGSQGIGFGFNSIYATGSNANQDLNLMPKGNGNVGVGTANPQAKLDVKGAIRAGNSDIYFTETTHNHSGFGNPAGFAAIENAQPPFNCLMILGRAGTPNGRKVGVWDYLQVNGTFANSSDAREKRDVTDLDYGLKEITQLRPVSFNWKDIANPHKSMGLVAQEVMPILGEAVYRDEKERDDHLSIAYTSLIPVLINAVKELAAKVEQLSGEVTAKVG